MSQDLLKQSDIVALENLLLRSQQSRAREALCLRIGIEPKRLWFLKDSSDSDFAIQLINHLNEIGDKEALCNLCCQELYPIFHKGPYAPILRDIIINLNCEQHIKYNQLDNKIGEQQISPTPSPVSEFSINSFNLLDVFKHQSLFKIISDHKKKFLAVAVILVFGLLGYPAYKALNPPKVLVTSIPNGSLPKYQEGSIPVTSTNVNLRNFIVEAQFHNPYDGAIDNWTYGFSFKENFQDNPANLNDPRNQTFDIWIISKEKKWEFSSSNRGVIEGNLKNIDVSNNGSNKLRLIVQDKQAIFYVNDILVQTFDISNFSQKGDVFLIAKNGISGKYIQYENLNLWSLDN